MSTIRLCAYLAAVSVAAAAYIALRGQDWSANPGLHGAPHAPGAGIMAGPADAADAADADDAAPDASLADNLSAYYARLRALGLTEHEIKPLILARLEERRAHARKRGPFRYWRREGGPAVVSALRDELAAGAALRAALVELYGEAAPEDPTFARVFRPLDDRLGFLSSEQQVRIQRARIEQRIAAGEGATGPATSFLAGRPVQPMGAPPPPLAREREWRQTLASILDEDLMFEYALRESALAEQLRNADMDLSETEFREVYTLLAELTERADAEALRATRARLRALLGSERFDRLWASRDPVYPVLSELMQAHGGTPAAILAAYGVLNDAQDGLAEAAVLAGRDPLRGIEAARAVAAREETRLAELVGAELARRILTARAQALFEQGQRELLPR